MFKEPNLYAERNPLDPYLEMLRRRDEAQRNQKRLAEWWERYCEANPMIWATNRRPPAVMHPFRRYA